MTFDSNSSGQKASISSNRIDKDKILTMAYTYPQEYFNLEEEDASEFLLDIYPDLMKIADNYNRESGTFEAYFYSIMKVRVRMFLFHKQMTKRTQKVINQVLGSDLYFQSIEKNGFSDETKESKALRFILGHSEAARRKFFVMFLCISPYLERETIESCCRVLKFEFSQTMDLISRLFDKCYDEISIMEDLKEKRTTYFTKYIQSQGLSVAESSAMRNLTLCRRKNEEISNIQRKTSYKPIADLLNLSVGTIGNYLFYSRKLLMWVSDPDKTKMEVSDYSPSRRVLDYARKYLKGLDELPKKKIKMFYPKAEFNIKI